MTEKYEKCKGRIKFLIEKLPNMTIEYRQDAQYVGEAVSYLRLFVDMMESEKQNEKNKIE